MAMLKDGKLQFMIERLDIENNDANTVANKVAYILKSVKENQEA
jgi:hypothetical protein